MNLVQNNYLLMAFMISYPNALLQINPKIRKPSHFLISLPTFLKWLNHPFIARSPGLETPAPSIPSPLTFEVPKTWFENHTTFGKWINVYRQRSLSFVDILNYTFFLFEDFNIFSSFI